MCAANDAGYEVKSYGDGEGERDKGVVPISWSCVLNKLVLIKMWQCDEDDAVKAHSDEDIGHGAGDGFGGEECGWGVL
jgi:hypothetical protein